MSEELKVTNTEVKKETVKEKAQSWSEKHPKLAKVGKGIGIGLGALALGTVGFFLGRRSSDVVTEDDCPPDVDYDID